MVELTSPPVRGDQAAAGDRIEGRLVNAIRDPVQQTIRVPAGAAMVGRLMRVETRWGPPAEITFALRWETVGVDGTLTPIELKPTNDGQRVGQVQIRKEFLDRAQIRILTNSVDGKPQTAGLAYYLIPLNKSLNKAPAPIALPPRLSVKK